MVAARRGAVDHYFLDRRAARIGAAGRVRDLEGGRHAVGAEYRGGMGAEEHPSQRDRAGPGRTDFARALWENPALYRRAHQGYPAATDRRARRDCRRGSVSRLERGQFHDRPDHRDRWRHHRRFGRFSDED